MFFFFVLLARSSFAFCLRIIQRRISTKTIRFSLLRLLSRSDEFSFDFITFSEGKIYIFLLFVVRSIDFFRFDWKFTLAKSEKNWREKKSNKNENRKKRRRRWKRRNVIDRCLKVVKVRFVQSIYVFLLLHHLFGVASLLLMFDALLDNWKQCSDLSIACLFPSVNAEEGKIMVSRWIGWSFSFDISRSKGRSTHVAANISKSSFPFDGRWKLLVVCAIASVYVRIESRVWLVCDMHDDVVRRLRLPLEYDENI